MGKVLDIAAYENWNIAVGYDRIIYVWGDFFPDYYINTPFPTKFSRIYDVFISRKGRMYKPLTVFLNNYKYVDEVLNILKSLEAAFDDPVCFLLLYISYCSAYMYCFALYNKTKYTGCLM